MALADFQRAFELNSRYLPAIPGYADLLWERGQRPEAEAAYRVVLDDFPRASSRRASASGCTADAEDELPFILSMRKR